MCSGGGLVKWWTNCIRLDTHPERVNEVLAALEQQQDPVALDTETTGCDPTSKGPEGCPVRFAKAWCLTLAWGRQGGDYGELAANYGTAFVPGVLLPLFAPWLESNAPKVGANIFGYDCHAVRNVGPTLGGVIADTVRMSRLLAPDSLQHDLKTWGRQLGWTITELDKVACRRKGGKVSKPGKSKGVEVWERQNVSWAKTGTQIVPVDELWRDYPGRREDLVKYAVQDAAMTLDTYWFLRRSLEGLCW